MTRALGYVSSIIATMILVGLWQLAADARLVSPIFLPGPDRAWAALVRGISNGNLVDQLLVTIRRMAIGWLLASLLAIVAGALIGISKTVSAYVSPTLEFIRPLPASAMVPVAVAMFGLTEGMVLFIIIFGSVWPVLLSTVEGFRTVEPRLMEVSRILKLGYAETIWKILLPSAMPDILAGMRVGLSVALILTVVGEMLASKNGLGQYILLASRGFQTADLYAGIILLGLVGLVSGLLLASLDSYLLRWRAASR